MDNFGLTLNDANASTYFLVFRSPFIPPSAHCIKVERCFVIYYGFTKFYWISVGLNYRLFIFIFFILAPISSATITGYIFTSTVPILYLYYHLLCLCKAKTHYGIEFVLLGYL